jgi:type IV secretory pathway TrbD component
MNKMTRGTPAVFYQSLNRQFAMLGVNQKLFLLFIVFWMPIILAWRLNPFAILVGLLIFAILHAIGILLTRADDQILEVYNRHRRFKNDYPSISGIHAELTKTKNSVPYYEGKRGLV